MHEGAPRFARHAFTGVRSSDQQTDDVNGWTGSQMQGSVT